ncbi:hypothetical protein GDO81_004362 [Engystomops pustulosus]|uniref:Beta-microseminoprotein n=1 Tax=Engystomops pustulosus TaxID=76066 RepID=A0AAV7A0Z6_ENGPU|nr:hypothetical protein GDO81_004362 [Engystomops pustulosus]
MTFLVTLAFGAGILVVACNAACYRSGIAVTFGEEPEGCYHRRKLYPLYSQWRTKTCYDCRCFGDGNYECCQVHGTPVNYDKERCHFEFDKEKCVYNLIPNEDPTKQCQSYGMVG